MISQNVLLLRIVETHVRILVMWNSSSVAHSSEIHIDRFPGRLMFVRPAYKLLYTLELYQIL